MTRRPTRGSARRRLERLEKQLSDGATPWGDGEQTDVDPDPDVALALIREAQLQTALQGEYVTVREAVEA